MTVVADASSGVPWYAAGLRFSCTRCGNCCTGSPGFTWVSDAEIAALAKRHQLSDADFRENYTRTVWRQGQPHVSLLDRRVSRNNHACIFFVAGKGCGVYEDRPRQCRTWPFWRRNLESPTAWAEEAKECPGMNRGETYAPATISAIAADDGLP